jgi:hypothetical protein
MKKNKILLTTLVLLSFLQAGEKLDSLDKKTEEFYKNISKMEESTPSKTTTKEKKISEKQSSKTTQKETNDTPKDVSQSSSKTNTNLSEESKKFENLKISSIYKFNGKKFVVFVTADADGRYTENDVVLGYTIDTINTTTKTVSMSKEIDKNIKYYIDLSPEGISWKKSH